MINKENNYIKREEEREPERRQEKERLAQLGEALLKNARRELYLSLRFLGAVLDLLPFCMRADIRGVGTEGEKLYFHTKTLAECYEQDPVLVNRMYLHLLLHCLFYHPFRTQSCGERLDGELWQIAADIAVEAVIDGLSGRALRRLPSPGREECYARLKASCGVLTAETVYHALRRSGLSPEKRELLRREFVVDDHALWQTERKEKEQEKEQPSEEARHEQIPERWRQASRAAQAELERYLRRTGSEAGTLTEVLRVENRKRQSLSDFLRRFAVTREEVHCDEDSFDRNFYTYGLSLYGNLPLVEPLEYREISRVEEFVIVVDTSGSCSGDTVRRFLEQVYAIWKERDTFFHRFVLHLIQADVSVTKDTVITEEEELAAALSAFEVRGGGGTDFRPAFAYVEQLRERGELARLKGLLYFTDGVGRYPERRTDYRTVFVFLKKLGDASELPVPVWAERLVLEEEDW